MFKRKPLLCGLSLFLTIGCGFYQKGEVHIRLQGEAGKALPVGNVLFFDYDEQNENRQHRLQKKLLVQMQTDGEGQAFFPMDFSRLQGAQVVITFDDLDNIYLPIVQTLRVPEWWQSQTLELVLPLHPVSSPTDANFVADNKKLQEEQKQQQGSANGIPDTLSREDFSSETTTQVGPENFSAQEKGSQTVTIEVFSEQGQPIEDAAVFGGRSSAGTLFFLGFTDSKGVFKVSALERFAPDTLFIQKSLFSTVKKADFLNDGKAQSFPRVVKIVLEKESGFSLFLQSYAYGVGRGANNTELIADGVKLDDSGLFGFVRGPHSLTEGKRSFSLLQENVIPGEITLSFPVVENLRLDETKLPILYSIPRVPYKPAVGFIEPPLVGFLETNSLWRRFRREFFSRFVSESAFKGLLYSDLKQMSALVSQTPVETALKGWQTAPFASELDLIMQLQLMNEFGKELTVVGTLYDRTGRLLFTRKIEFSDGDAEVKAAQLYLSFLSAFPFEGAITHIQSEKKAILNMGENFFVQKGDRFQVFTGLTPFSLPEAPVVLVQVDAVFAEGSLVSVVDKKGNFKKFMEKKQWLLRAVRSRD